MLSASSFRELLDAAPDRADGGCSRPPRCADRPAHHLLTQDLRTVDDAVSRPLRLLHLRQAAGAPRRAVPLGGAGTRARGTGRGARLLRGALHPRRGTRGSLPTGRAVVTRAGFREHRRLSRRGRQAGARRDRPAPPRERGRAVGSRSPPPARRQPLAGDDAGDARRSVARARRRGQRLPRQDRGAPPGHAARRGPGPRAVHDRHTRRHRRDAAPSASRHSSRLRTPTSSTGTSRK